MFRIVLFAFSFLLFVGCSTKTTVATPSQKVFDEEDTYIVFALYAEREGDFRSAADFYNLLYTKAGKKEYFYKELGSLIALKEYDKALAKIDKAIKGEKSNDLMLLRLRVLTLFAKHKFLDAKQEALKLVKLSHKDEDYILLADIYIQLKKYTMAVKYLEGAYSKNYDEKILDKISIILYVNLQKKKEAIAQLETHMRMFGCSETICSRLLSFYSNQNNVDGLLGVYKRYYQKTEDEEILHKIIQLYAYKKDHMGLVLFLEKNGKKPEILLEIYVAQKNYKKAYKLAYKLYKNSSNIDYLAKGSIYEYEATKNPTKKELHAIVAKLTKVVEQKPTGLYLNYLGYLLIDHNLDYSRGIAYIKKALKIHPNSAYYLDSLAWGYYKQNKCKKSYRLFRKIEKLEGGQDPEVLKHYKKVQQCYKRGKR